MLLFYSRHDIDLQKPALNTNDFLTQIFIVSLLPVSFSHILFTSSDICVITNDLRGHFYSHLTYLRNQSSSDYLLRHSRYQRPCDIQKHSFTAAARNHFSLFHYHSTNLLFRVFLLPYLSCLNHFKSCCAQTVTTRSSDSRSRRAASRDQMNAELRDYRRNLGTKKPSKTLYSIVLPPSIN